MFILSLIRFIKGYIKFEAFGAFPEQFLNFASCNNISLWNVKSNKGFLSAFINVKKYKQLRYISKKSGMRMKIKKKYGLPFMLFKYRKRTGVFVGIILFFAILYFLSMFVWSINISGNTSLPNEKITSELAAIGLRPGTYKSNIKAKELQQKLVAKIPELSWIAINIEGSKANILIEERTLSPEVIPVDKPSNVIASKSGQIISMEVYEGMPMVKIGDAVVKGDLLISGGVENKLGETVFKHARGKVTASTNTEIEIKIPLKNDDISLSDNKTDKKSINFLSVNIPLYFKPAPSGDYEYSFIEKPLNIFGLELPISIQIERYTELNHNNSILTIEEAKLKAENLLKEKESTELSQSKIIDKIINTKETIDYFVLNVNYICEETINFEEEILLNS